MVTVSCESVKQTHRKDRMSDLPDAIIQHILSFVDAKDAVRSGILSKRFAYLWTETPCLNFEESTMESINTTICFHKRCNLEKVSVIKYRNSYHEETEICRFIWLLGLAKVKEVILELDGYYRLPQHFYSNPSLTKISLMLGSLEPNGFVNWKSLRSLFLTHVFVDGQAIKNIISGCPSIELLVLSKCFYIWSFDLSNRCLKKLVIDNCYPYKKLKISAANLQSLVLLGRTNCSRYKLLEVNSLTNACLDFFKNKWLAEDTMVKDLSSLLDNISHIEAITIGKWVIQILSLMKLKELPCPLSNTIKFLKLRSNFTADDMIGVAYLLRNLNRLEKLVIEIRNYDRRYIVPYFHKQHQVSLKNEGYCSSEIMENLRTVEILGLGVDLDIQLPYVLKHILLLVEFLLKNAKFLENMTIKARGSMHYLMELKDKLLGFPRSSHSAVVKIMDC